MAEPEDLVLDDIFHVDTADVDIYEAFNPVLDNLEQQYFRKLPPAKKPIKLLVDKTEEEKNVPQMDPKYEQFLKIIACNKCMTNKKIVMNSPCGCIQNCAYCNYKQLIMQFSGNIIRIKNR